MSTATKKFGSPVDLAQDRASRTEGFRRLLKATQIIQWEADAQTRDFTYVGSQAERLLGFPLAQWLEPAFWKAHLHPEDLDRVLRFREEALLEQEAYEFEYRMIAAAGHSVWVHDVVAVDRVDGVPDIIRGFLIDVTARKRAQATARASEARVHQLMEQAPDAIIAVSADQRIAFVNRQAERLFGYEPGSLVGRKVDELFPGQFGEAGLLESCGPKPKDTGGFRPVPDVGSNLGRRADGGTFPVAVNFGRLDTDDDLIIVITARDVSEQLKAETALRQSEERFRIAATLGGDIVAEVNIPTNAVQWFGQVDLALGYAPDEFPRTRDGWISKIHPEDRERAREEDRRAISGSTRWPTVESWRVGGFNYRIQAKDGSYRHWKVRMAPRLEGTGPPTTIIVVCMDITDEVAARSEALEHRDALAHVARVSSLGELTAALAHELNQPLAAILSNAQAAARLLDRDPPEIRETGEVLRDIVADDRRAGAIIKRLRAMIRRETPSRAPIDLGQVVQEVIEIMRGELATRDAIVVCDFVADLPAVVADRIQIQQVVVNLVTNALQAMEGKTEARLSVGVHRRNDEWQVVSVADIGPGIEVSMLDTMFEPFNTSRAGGLGMGLSISRSIIEAHGGEITAKNRVEDGAMISFALPPQQAVNS